RPILFARGRIDLQEVDLRHVAAIAERAVLVVNIGDAARHAGREIAPGTAKHCDDAAGHVFAAVVARPFDDRDRARVADRETFARYPVEGGFTGDGAVEDGIADDDVFGRVPVDVRWRTHDDAAAGEALAHVV